MGLPKRPKRWVNSTRQQTRYTGNAVQHFPRKLKYIIWLIHNSLGLPNVLSGRSCFQHAQSSRLPCPIQIRSGNNTGVVGVPEVDASFVLDKSRSRTRLCRFFIIQVEQLQKGSQVATHCTPDLTVQLWFDVFVLYERRRSDQRAQAFDVRHSTWPSHYFSFLNVNCTPQWYMLHAVNQ